jgi:hypothetical protein
MAVTAYATHFLTDTCRGRAHLRGTTATFPHVSSHYSIGSGRLPAGVRIVRSETVLAHRHTDDGKYEWLGTPVTSWLPGNQVGQGTLVQTYCTAHKLPVQIQTAPARDTSIGTDPWAYNATTGYAPATVDTECLHEIKTIIAQKVGVQGTGMSLPVD